MLQTILLLVLITGLILFLLYISIKQTRFSKKTRLLSTTIFIIAILLLFAATGIDKIKSDISRVIRNSTPKNAATVYSILFSKPIDSCVITLNFKDQVIPKIDCCIWMELQVCPAELKRITSLKNYTKTRFHQSDSLTFLNPFDDRPSWWAPQLLGDSLVKYHIQFNHDNEQVIFFGLDSTHVYACDKAL